MKKLTLLLTCFVVFSISTYAQISKGTLLIGGNLHVNTTNNTFLNTFSAGNTYENTSANGGIFPAIGYFVSEKLAVGINPGFMFNRNNTVQSPTQSVETNTYNFSVGPFIRYYQTLGDRVSVFGQTSLAFSFGKTNTENIFQNMPTTIISNNFGINVGINPGIVFFVTRRLGFEATFGTLSYAYNSSTTENNENKNTSFNLSLNISSLGLGVQYYLGR